MAYRLKITQNDYEQLQKLVFADMPNEAGAFALAGIAQHNGFTDIIVRRPIEIPKELFHVQSEYRLEMAPKAINGLIALCESNNLGAVLCHSHPSDSPYSSSDDFGENRIFSTLRQFIPPHFPTASLLLYPGGVRGRAWLPNLKMPVPISEIMVIGSHIKRIGFNNQSSLVNDEIFDRQIRAFGTDGQQLISQSKVAIVGLGGTGSPVAEQLTRLGVKDFVLIDHDTFEPSNITRMYGTFANSNSKSWWNWKKKPVPKVELIAKHLKSINPKVKIKAIRESVVVAEASKYLLDRDVIFLCTDDHWGRSIVNQVTHQYFIPTINLGTRISPKFAGGVGVIDILRPDEPCLWCKQSINADRIATESIPQTDRHSLAKEGYVEDLDNVAPSVVSITTAIAGMAVTQYLNLLSGFMGISGNVSRLNYNIMDGTVTRGTTNIDKACACQTNRAFGDLKELPTVDNIDFLNN